MGIGTWPRQHQALVPVWKIDDGQVHGPLQIPAALCVSNANGMQWVTPNLRQKSTYIAAVASGRTSVLKSQEILQVSRTPQ